MRRVVYAQLQAIARLQGRSAAAVVEELVTSRCLQLGVLRGEASELRVLHPEIKAVLDQRWSR